MGTELSFQSGFGSGCGLILAVFMGFMLLFTTAVGGCALLVGGCALTYPTIKAAQEATERAVMEEEKRAESEEETGDDDEQTSPEQLPNPTIVW